MLVPWALIRKMLAYDYSSYKTISLLQKFFNFDALLLHFNVSRKLCIYWYFTQGKLFKNYRSSWLCSHLRLDASKVAPKVLILVFRTCNWLFCLPKNALIEEWMNANHCVMPFMGLANWRQEQVNFGRQTLCLLFTTSLRSWIPHLVT